MTRNLIENSSPEGLRLFIIEIGAGIFDVTESVIMCLELSRPKHLALLGEIRNKTYSTEKISDYLIRNINKISENVLIVLFEVFEDVFTSEVIKIRNRLVHRLISLETSDDALSILCFGQTKRFYKLLESVVRSKIPTKTDVVNAASSNKKVFDLLMIYNSKNFDSEFMASIIRNRDVEVESIRCILSRIDIYDQDLIAEAFIDRFRSDSVEDSLGRLCIYEKLCIPSKFRKTITRISELDLVDMYENLYSRGLLELETHEMVELFCKNDSRECLKVVLKSHDTYLDDQDVEGLIDRSSQTSKDMLRYAVGRRTIKSPEKLLDSEFEFEFVRSVYRDIESDKLTNPGISASIKLAETIINGEDFSDLDETILPSDFSEAADRYYSGLVEDVKIPKKFSFPEYLAVLKYYRKCMNSYDIEVLLRDPKISGIVSRDSAVFSEMLSQEKLLLEQESD